MLVFSKEKKYLLSIIIIIIDGLISYFNPSYYDNLSYFLPMLTISLIPFLYQDNLKEYYYLCFINGIIYDLFYSNIFLLNAFLFLLLAKIDSKILKLIKSNLLLYLFLIIINIIIYDSILCLLIYLTKYSIVTFQDLIIKIEHSLIINVLSGFVYYFLCRKRIY